jgi:mevalonate kinase
MNRKIFYSKILLFGEYGIISNSDALSIPFKKFEGSLKISKSLLKDEILSNNNLDELYTYVNKSYSFSNILDLKSLKKDIDSGLYFKSNIPISSGLGSSGALVSSILINYANTDLNKKDSNEIKKIMSIMESKFHGKSSGFDPLASFFNKPIMMSGGNVKLIEDIKFRDFKIYLVDSKIPSSTSDMISIFNQKMNDENFMNLFNNSFIPITNKCIHNLINNSTNFLDSIKSLSKFTNENMNEMIPESIDKIWKSGLKSNDYYMKFCGSGGGGFFLAFDFKNNLKAKLSAFELIEI